MDASSQPKVLQVGVLTGAFNLDPLKAQDVDSLFVLRQVVEAPFATRPGTTDLETALFNGPLKRDPESPNTLRAQLRPELVFSDGQPVTAQDVAECLSKVALVREQAEVEAHEEEVVFRLRVPNPRFDVTLSHPQCSIHRWQGGRLLGTGPYQLGPASPPGTLRLVRNPRHREPVRIDEVCFRSYPLDAEGKPSALAEAIQDGEAHYTNVLARDDINALSGVRKSFLPGISTSILYLNTQSPRLADARVRQAIAHAIDRIEVARSAYTNALAFAAPGLLPRSLGVANDTLGYDPARSRELLDQPGVGRPRRLTLLMMWAPRPYLPYPERYRDAIAKALAKHGIEVVAVPTTSSLEYAAKLIAGEEDMVLAGWVADVMDPADFLEANLASNRVPNEENISVSTNSGRLVSPEMDAALAAYRTERSSESLEEVMRVMSEQASLVPLAYGPTTAVVSYRVKDFKPSPLSIFPLSQLDLE